jgi:hypothetical protein
MLACFFSWLSLVPRKNTLHSIKASITRQFKQWHNKQHNMETRNKNNNYTCPFLFLASKHSFPSRLHDDSCLEQKYSLLKEGEFSGRDSCALFAVNGLCSQACASNKIKKPLNTVTELKPGSHAALASGKLKTFMQKIQKSKPR